MIVTDSKNHQIKRF
ncbi:hypothetical protein [Rhizobium sp. SL86]